MSRRAGVAALAVLAAAACGGPPRYPPPEGDTAFATKPDGQWRLPAGLREASGLAATADGKLLAHDDERAVIYEIDIADARMGRAISFGTPPSSGDFEGVAQDSLGRIYLITSTGKLHRGVLGGDGAVGTIEVFDTGLRGVCEVEGLAFDPARDSLIVACKTPYLNELNGFAAFRSWSVAREALDEDYALNVPVSDIASKIGVAGFSPSGVDVDPATGRLIVVAARENALAELAADGTVLAARRLSPLHVQAEGVAVGADGRLYVVDEAGPRDAARIAVYARRDDD